MTTPITTPSLIDDLFNSLDTAMPFLFDSSSPTTPFSTSTGEQVTPTMDRHLSNDSSPTEFAFNAPALPDPPKQYPQHSVSPPMGVSGTSAGVTGSGQFAFTNGFNPYAGYSSTSSFSSVGSATGSSFSTDGQALPPISNQFARPSPTETRRPATAGGALQGQNGTFQRNPPSSSGSISVINEESSPALFTNPFSPSQKDSERMPPPSNDIDPRISANRRASESQLAGNWGMGINPSQTQLNNFAYLQQINPQVAQLQQRVTGTSRPSTSDGIPGFSVVQPNSVHLPSARSIVGQIDYTQYNGMPFRDARSSLPEMSAAAHSSFPGDRSYSLSAASVRPSYIAPGEVDQNSLTFVPIGGPTPKKRPRRRFDEIERLYKCGWSGCEKSYGTLNHLNAHVSMQKHGEKRLPAEFKDMRKAWRKKKRDSNASSQNGQYAQNGSWNRSSLSSSDSDFDRRESNTSMASEYSSARGSMYGQGHFGESRPTTASSFASVASDGRPFSSMTYASPNPLIQSRRPSAPSHIPMPQQMQSQPFRQNEGDYPTPTPQNPFPHPAQQRMQMPQQYFGMPGVDQYGGQFAFQR